MLKHLQEIKNVNIIINFRFLILFLSFAVQSQNTKDSLVIDVKIQFNNQDLELNKKFISTLNDTIYFDKIKFYLSDIQLVYKDKKQFTETKSYYLIDLDKFESMRFSIPHQNKTKMESLKFNIGIDSLASVSGALEGVLDATNGMYWAWQSGFVNFKIEGKSSSCASRKNKFQFHIGGYLDPNYALRSVVIPVQNIQFTNHGLNLIMDLGKLFSEIKLKETNSIMIPGKEAMKMADLSTQLFSIE